MSPLGRPRGSTKLTRDLKTQLADCIRKGATIKAACELCEVSTSALYRWLEEGEKASAGLFFELTRELHEAKKEAERERLKALAPALERHRERVRQRFARLGLKYP